MTTSYLYSRWLIILSLGSFLLLSACNSEKTPETKEAAVTDTTKKETPKMTATAAAFSGYLDTLYIEKNKFLNNTRDKYIFRFYAVDADHLTLHGWQAKGMSGTQYDDPPQIQLENGNATAVSYGAGIYLGNVILYKDGFKTIQILLQKPQYNYVIFVPYIKTQGGLKHVAYQIFVGDKKPGFAKVFITDPTGVDGNPSPPKGYTD